MRLQRLKASSSKLIFLLLIISVFMQLQSKDIKKGPEPQSYKIAEFLNLYLENQSEENFQNLIQWLHAERNVEFLESTETTTIMKLINDNSKKLEILLLRNDQRTLKIIFYLLFNDEIRSEFPYYIFGKLIKTNPKIFLIQLKNYIIGNGFEKNGDFEILDVILNETDIDTTGNVDIEIQETNKRIRSLMTVQDKILEDFRDKCVGIMRTKINYFQKRGNIPSNLEESYKILKTMLDKKEIDEMKKGSESDMAKYHFGLGMWIRNNWGLWSGKSKLAKYFNNLGIFHPDNMSALILETFWCHLNHRDLKLKERIKKCQDDEISMEKLENKCSDEKEI